MATRSNLVGSRLDFARLCNDRGYKLAAEIGTDRGVFAREFLDIWTGEMLFCIDPWVSYPHMLWDRTGDYHLALHLLAPHAKRVRIIRAHSATAVGYFKRGEPLPRLLDFIYLDGDHHPDAFVRDIHLWWPFVRKGGVFAGDDYGDVHPGIRIAIEDFAAGVGLTVQLTTDYNREPSWYLEKL